MIWLHYVLVFSEFFSQPSSSGGQHREVPPGTRIEPAALFSCLLLVQPVFHLNALLYFFALFLLPGSRLVVPESKKQQTTSFRLRRKVHWSVTGTNRLCQQLCKTRKNSQWVFKRSTTIKNSSVLLSHFVHAGTALKHSASNQMKILRQQARPAYFTKVSGTCNRCPQAINWPQEIEQNVKWAGRCCSRPQPQEDTTMYHRPNQKTRKSLTMCPFPSFVVYH